MSADYKIVGLDHPYVVPKREILLPEDMQKWKNSEAYQEYHGFIATLNEAVKGKAVSYKYPASDAIGKVIQLLDLLDSWVDKFPPEKQPQRFGNQAFRSWYNHLQKEAPIELKKILPSSIHQAIPELCPYLIEGFGNSTRIDYGSGHEMSFLWFMACLFKVGFLSMDDKCAVALKVFDRYMILVRKLQTTYRMEPAGSHGVWSLDDFQFVPFIWGSAQLIGHPKIEPKSFLVPEIAESYQSDYLFLAAIAYINKVKTGPFFEHSNQLYNVSGVGEWQKINQGLKKMYDVEVLGKFPVVQHALFGSLMSIAPAAVAAPPTSTKVPTSLSNSSQRSSDALSRLQPPK